MKKVEFSRRSVFAALLGGLGAIVCRCARKAESTLIHGVDGSGLTKTTFTYDESGRLLTIVEETSDVAMLWVPASNAGGLICGDE